MVIESLAQVAPRYQTPISEQPADIEQYISQLKERLGAMTPVEESARKALEVELSVRKLIQSFQAFEYTDPTWLDISIMRMTAQQLIPNRREFWLVPRLALVPVFGNSPYCSVEYPDDEYSHRWSLYDRLIDRRALEDDIRGLKNFFSPRRRRIVFKFEAPLPDAVRNKAQIAIQHGFEVYLICDARDQWNGQYVAADPLLVAERHGKWVYLDIFDPTGIEEWVAGEMRTPLSVK